MSLYRSISETDSDFALKSLNIPTHSVFNAPADAFPFEFWMSEWMNEWMNEWNNECV